MDRLIEGFHRFKTKAWPDHRATFERLAKVGQSPRTMVIACSDSRVDPQLIFDAGPGEIFTVRNVANLVPPYQPSGNYHGTSAALEFGVRGLHIEDIVVLGHAQCGGISALLNNEKAGGTDFIDLWMEIAAPAREHALAAADGRREAAQVLCEHECVRLSLANLLTFPWLKSRVEGGDLRLHGAYFGVASGALLWLDQTGAFKPV